MVKSKLTLKQERFCEAYIETGNASEAYRISYNAEAMKPETIHKRASELLMNGEVRGRIQILRSEQLARYERTVDEILFQLLQIAEQAMKDGKYSASVRALELLGKRIGLWEGPNLYTEGEMRQSIELLQTAMQNVLSRFIADPEEQISAKYAILKELDRLTGEIL